MKTKPGKCSECGGPLVGSGEGLCHICLLRLGLDEAQATEPGPATAPPSAPSTPMPERIGPYRIKHRLGEGGMGVVYLAEQLEPLKRQVALKRIKHGVDSKTVLARFDIERQSLALMDHPCIARVYDAGATETGEPYVVMEYVDGLPITEYCDKHRLATRERLDLFAKVCDAIQHAHQKGVIHRDLKPTNILVVDSDGRPLPKVIDFGVAKATGQRQLEWSVFTEMGWLVGTPEYMSPEQVNTSAADVDTRTDVYSLGVLLYELLVGSLPFQSDELRRAGYDELRRIIRESDPPRPSTRLLTLEQEQTDAVARSRRTARVPLARELKGDLDWVVMRALEKERARRYASPQAFAEDVRRYLENRPVVARPPSPAYRLRKAVGRHRAATAAVLVAFAALTVGAAGLVGGLFTARSEREEAERQTAIARAVNQFVLEDLLAAANLDNPGGKRDLTVLDAARGASDRIGERFQDQPEVEASIRRTLAAMLTALDSFADAESHLTVAVDLLDRVRGPHDDLTLAARNELAETVVQQARYDEAEQVFAELVEIRRQAFGVEHRETLAVMNNLAFVYDMQGRLTESEPIHAEVLGIRRRLYGTGHPDTLVSINNLAYVYFTQRRLGEAIELWQEHSRKAPEVFGEVHPETINNAVSLAGVLIAQARYDEAIELLESKHASAERALGPDHRGTLAFLDLLGAAHRELGDFEAAEPTLHKAFAGYTKTLGPDHPNTNNAATGYALVLVETGRADEAEAILADAVARFREQFPDGHANLAGALTRQARCFSAQKRYAAAESALLEANTFFAAAFGSDYSLTTRTASDLATLYDEWGRPEEAEHWRKAAGS